MKISRLLKRKGFRIAVCVYALLWLITAVFANRDLDREFDEQFRYGYENREPDAKVEITRIGKLNVRNLAEPSNYKLLPSNGLFRFRSRGVVVAPFIVVDEIGTIFAPLGGIGGLRLNLWFFGATKSWMIRVYWHA